MQLKLVEYNMFFFCFISNLTHLLKPADMVEMPLWFQWLKLIDLNCVKQITYKSLKKLFQLL
jgi:hypothetical protein